LADLLAGAGRSAEAAGLRAEVCAALERAAADLPDDLRAPFAASALARRARPG
jgi:hypothetical protein